MTLPDARAAAEHAARASHGRLVGLLSARTRDIAAAEDALADAFARALESWPNDGVPANPDAWLLTVARRSHGHQARRQGVAAAAQPALLLLADERAEAGAPATDPRLELMFVCAHPAIDAVARTPMMLTVVQGLTAERVAAAYLEAPATMGQRLVRAKARVKATDIPFQLPNRSDWPDRLGAVLEAVYAIASLAEGEGDGLLDEAVHLGRLLADALPREPEVRGLMALLLFLKGRRAAGRDLDGLYVPLDRQEPSRWDTVAIDAGERELAAAATLGRPGRYQLEAAIHSAHCWRRTGGATPWVAILSLHDRLALLAPTIGSEIARACALGEVHGPAAALERLAGLDAPAGCLPLLAAQAHWLDRAGRPVAARTAWREAVLAAHDPVIRRWLSEPGRAGAGAG